MDEKRSSQLDLFDRSFSKASNKAKSVPASPFNGIKVAVEQSSLVDDFMESTEQYARPLATTKKPNSSKVTNGYTEETKPRETIDGKEFFAKARARLSYDEVGLDQLE